MAQHGSKKFGDEDLRGWQEIAGGGFGVVYRVRHKNRGFIAIKLLRQNTDSTDELYKEADCLTKMSSEYVLTVYGIYQGNPLSGTSEKQGIVMEFMERGSIHTLQKGLDGPPPLPLAVRLAYQVALGMQHLHSKNFLHHDLKPSNVLLDKTLNAKLADFGLSRVTTSVLSNIQQSTGGVPGTYQYMPPEALNDINYNAVRSFDVYSYGILLWSILSGKEPYKGKEYSMVAHRIPKGDRPDISLCLKEEEEHKKIMVKLMQHCWDGEPSNRPDFNEIVRDTNSVFLVHEEKIAAVIDQVLSKLDQNQSESSSQLHQPNAADLVTSHTPVNVLRNDIVDHPRETQLTTVDFKMENLSENEKAKFVDNRRHFIIKENTQVMEITEELRKMGMVQKETYSKIKSKDTTEEKMRELYQTSLRSGGVKVKAAFYDAVKKHEPEMLKIQGNS